VRTIIAVCYPHLEEYIYHLPYLEIVEVCTTREDLVNSCCEFNPELVIISNVLTGHVDMEQVIISLISDTFRKPRIIYLYGDDDGSAKQFCNFLEDRNIKDYYVGYNLTSIELDDLINNAIGRSSIGVSAKGKADTYYKKEKNFNSLFRSIVSNKKDNAIGTTVRSVVDNMVITIYSAHVTGKSHTAWNLAYCLSKLNYKKSIINMDRGYSANIYYGIDEIYHGLLDYTIRNDSYSNILSSCYKRKNLNIISGRLGVEDGISSEEFSKLLYQVRTKSDITIIDTNTAINDVTISAIKNSSVDLLIFDSDLMHFNSNKQLISHMKNDFIPEKTIVLINNCDKASESYKFIYNQIKKMKLNFKGLLPISSCCAVACDLMHTDKVPYQIMHKQNHCFSEDFDRLLDILNLKEKHNVSKKILFR
jgi:MinD-like ATPase involved in chromosome partitioning or flagellar assembly